MQSKRDVQKFIDDMKLGRLSRRDFHKGLASVGLAMVATPLVSRPVFAAAEDHPTVYTWGGYEVPEMYGEYLGKYGEEPNFSLWGDEEEAEAKIRAGFHPDVGMPCSYKIKKWHELGFLKPIDTSRLEHWDDVIDVLKEVPDTFIDDQRLMVTGWWGLTSVTFRTDIAPEYIPEENHTWGILWDPKYAGRLSMIDSLIDGVMVAAIYSGAKDPFNMTSEEVERVRELMREQRPLLRFYTNDLTSWEQGLASGELVAAASWNDTPTRLIKEGLPVQFMKPKEGAMTWTCGMVLFDFVCTGNGGARIRSHERVSLAGDRRVLDRGVRHGTLQHQVLRAVLGRGSRYPRPAAGRHSRLHRFGNIPGHHPERARAAGHVRRGQSRVVEARHTWGLARLRRPARLFRTRAEAP